MRPFERWDTLRRRRDMGERGEFLNLCRVKNAPSRGGVNGKGSLSLQENHGGGGGVYYLTPIA